jgi:hypothetical protein
MAIGLAILRSVLSYLMDVLYITQALKMATKMVAPAHKFPQFNI